ncbi:hypothetical protein DVH05_016282 [Phytophthora capsici]|nr:hypothetical protein DVH05_016282 [Phytophthora capsici]
MGRQITDLHDQLGRHKTGSRRELERSLEARDELQAKLDQATDDLLSKQTALLRALHAQRRAQQDLVSVRAQADAQRTRIANLEGQVGSSQQHELSVRRLESEKTALANDLEAEQQARADAGSDRDRALRDQADAEFARDRLLAERQTVQAQLSSLGSIFGVPVQKPPQPPSTVKGQSSRSQSVPSRKPSPSSSRKRNRRASSGTPRPKRSRTSPPVTRSSSSHPPVVAGSTTGGTPSSPIVLSEEDDVGAQPDSGNVIDGDQDDLPDQGDHEDVDTQANQNNSQGLDHADQNSDDQKGQDPPGSPDNRSSPVPPATPPIVPGSNRERPHGGSPDSGGDPSGSSDNDSSSSSHHWSGASDSDDGSSDSLSSHDSDNTLLAAQEYEDLLPTVISRQRWIPGYRRPTVYHRQRDCDPWPLVEVSQLSIRRLRLDTLVAQWTRPKFWLFPRNPRVPAAADWHPGLITEANIRALYAANPPPWDALRRIVVPRSFEMNGWFADFCQRYEDFEESSRQVFWETTHKLPITPAMCAAEPFLEQYRKDCRVRRMRAGPRWKRLLKHLMAGLKSGECDLDLLLDPYFLHFPARGEQVCWYPGQGERQRPADLLAALQIVDRTDPW